MQIREYGDPSLPTIILLHGGPGVPGYLAPVGEYVGRTFHVLEPWQRGSGGAPLTVARHVEDLHALVQSSPIQGCPILAGHSWGAMLALAYAAAHPTHVAALALISCGTFDRVARHEFHRTCDARLTEAERERLARLPEEVPDANERAAERARLLASSYSYDIRSEELGLVSCDARAHEETWLDMLRLQEEGVYPAAFRAVDAPVLILHGAVDPHPGGLIRASLLPWLPQLEYYELARCGHYPWLERKARKEFFAILLAWLLKPGAQKG